MNELPIKPGTCFSVLSSSFEFWRKHLGVLLLVVAAPVILSAIPALTFPQMDRFSDYDVSKAFVHQHLLAAFIFAFILFYFYGFIVHRVHTMMYQSKATVAQSLLVAAKKLPYLIIALFIFNVTVFAGMLVLIIPGIAFAVLLSLYFVVIVVDNDNPFSGFKHSWMLVTEHWFHVFGIFAILMVTIFVVSGGIDFLAKALWVIPHPSGQGLLHLGNRLVRMFVGALFYSFFVVVQMMVYHDLKLRQKSS